ncbi:MULTISPECIES: DUF2782 domain-containing protein [Dyella]|nr:MULTISPECIES: DUF2782 domain-containing protein [Dyella]
MMKPIACLVVIGALAASPVFAQSSPQSFPPAPPPPGMNDAGVKPKPATKTPAKPINDKVPQLPATQGSATTQTAKPAATDANGDAAPEVTVRTEGEETIQEYRRSGMLYMVVVTPKSGIPQTYMVDAQGKWQKSGPRDPVKPVMYKVLEWGKSPPATEGNGK